MRWIEPTEKDNASATLEKRLWAAADQFRANSGLKAQEYSGPILGLIFLRFAEVRFAAQRATLEQASTSYTPDLYQQKCAALFEHMYEAYPERNSGVYASAGR